MRIRYVGSGSYFMGTQEFKAQQWYEVPKEIGKYVFYNPAFQAEYDDFEEICDVPLGVWGSLEDFTGYGGATLSIIEALNLGGVSPVVDPRQIIPDVTTKTTTYKKGLIQAGGIPFTQIMHTIPDNFSKAVSPNVIGYTMWESSRIPDGSTSRFGNWAEQTNRYCNELFVPSQHSKQVFADCGVRIPIRVVPYGIDKATWNYTPRDLSLPFTVVLFGDLTSRKSMFEAFQAFNLAFGSNPDVRLIFKTYGKSVLIPEISDPRVTVHTGFWEQSRIQQLMDTSHVLLWLSKGEGFGLPPVQAALAGLPVIMTHNSGMAEYYDPAYFWGVDEAEQAASPIGGEWSIPDVDHAALQLEFLYTDYKAAQNKAKAAYQYCLENFTLEPFSLRLLGALNGD